MCVVKGVGNILSRCRYTHCDTETPLCVCVCVRVVVVVVGAERPWDGSIVVGEGMGGLHGSGYLDRREQVVREWDVWCGGARPKKSHQCLPHVGREVSAVAGPLSAVLHIITCRRLDIQHGQRGKFSSFKKNI